MHNGTTVIGIRTQECINVINVNLAWRLQVPTKECVSSKAASRAWDEAHNLVEVFWRRLHEGSFLLPPSAGNAEGDAALQIPHQLIATVAFVDRLAVSCVLNVPSSLGLILPNIQPESTVDQPNPENFPLQMAEDMLWLPSQSAAYAGTRRRLGSSHIWQGWLSNKAALEHQGLECCKLHCQSLSLKSTSLNLLLSCDVNCRGGKNHIILEAAEL